MSKLASSLMMIAGAMLAAVASALVLANLSANVASSPADPVLGVSVYYLTWGIAAAAALIGGICLLGERASAQAMWVLWFAVNLLVYVGGLYWTGQWTLTTFVQMANVAEMFDLSASSVAALVVAMLGYLLIAGLVVCFSSWRQRRAGVQGKGAAGPETFKISCVHCEGHIAFPSTRLGEVLDCPHCRKPITLVRAASAP